MDQRRLGKIVADSSALAAVDLAENALHIAMAKGIPIYDAMFIALAEMEHATMITRDEKQARIARTLGIDAIIV